MPRHGVVNTSHSIQVTKYYAGTAHWTLNQPSLSYLGLAFDMKNILSITLCCVLVAALAMVLTDYLYFDNELETNILKEEYTRQEMGSKFMSEKTIYDYNDMTFNELERRRKFHLIIFLTCILIVSIFLASNLNNPKEETERKELTRSISMLSLLHNSRLITFTFTILLVGIILVFQDTLPECCPLPINQNQTDSRPDLETKIYPLWPDSL